MTVARITSGGTMTTILSSTNVAPCIARHRPTPVPAPSCGCQHVAHALPPRSTQAVEHHTFSWLCAHAVLNLMARMSKKVLLKLQLSCLILCISSICLKLDDMWYLIKVIQTLKHQHRFILYFELKTFTSSCLAQNCLFCFTSPVSLSRK
jgi:hypothetical protein